MLQALTQHNRGLPIPFIGISTRSKMCLFRPASNLPAFTSTTPYQLRTNSHLGQRICSRRAVSTARSTNQTIYATAAPKTPDDSSSPPEEIQAVERMRSRLEGLFGADDTDSGLNDTNEFDGDALRNTIQDRWGVQYDVQPQKRHGRVYVQIMWRYFEQQSFYMEEDEFANHCEAVAQLLQQWNAVDYFCDYISSIKKRPVVGIAINIPIPGIDAATVVFE